MQRLLEKRLEALRERIDSINSQPQGKSFGTPFCVYIPTVSGGELLFGYKAPIHGAVIVNPTISVEKLSGDLVLSGYVGANELAPIPLKVGNNTLSGELKLNPFDEVCVNLSGNGTATNVWITYYCAGLSG